MYMHMHVISTYLDASLEGVLEMQINLKTHSEPQSLFKPHGKSNWWIITVYLLETNMIERQNLSFHL